MAATHQLFSQVGHNALSTTITMRRYSFIHGSDLRDAHIEFSFRQGTVAHVASHVPLYLIVHTTRGRKWSFLLTHVDYLTLIGRMKRLGGGLQAPSKPPHRCARCPKRHGGGGHPANLLQLFS